MAQIALPWGTANMSSVSPATPAWAQLGECSCPTVVLKVVRPLDLPASRVRIEEQAAARSNRAGGPHGAGWSSPVAREAHNLEVAGSNPVPATLTEVPLKQALMLPADGRQC